MQYLQDLPCPEIVRVRWPTLSQCVVHRDYGQRDEAYASLVLSIQQ